MCIRDSLEPDVLLEQIRYLATVDGVKVVILDHISIVLSGLELDNERKAIDIIMTKLRSLSEATGIAIVLVSHLRRPQGQSHESGREVDKLLYDQKTGRLVVYEDFI